jgi:tetratricopeptide (TPR) repeat protein
VPQALKLASDYYRKGQFEPARHEVDQVLATQPENSQARLLLGLCYFQLGRLPEAVIELEQIYAAQPDDVVVFTLGLAYINLKEFDKAEELIKKHFRPAKTVEAHLLNGTFSIAVKDLPTAIAELSCGCANESAFADGPLDLGLGVSR